MIIRQNRGCGWSVLVFFVFLAVFSFGLEVGIVLLFLAPLLLIPLTKMVRNRRQTSFESSEIHVNTPLSAQTSAIFEALGYLAKSDGQVTAEEIQLAEQIFMAQQLSPEQRDEAIEYFNRGRDSTVSVRRVIRPLREQLSGLSAATVDARMSTMRIFVLFAAADGVVSDSEMQVLSEIASELTVARTQLESLIAMVTGQSTGTEDAHPSRTSSLADAYTELEISETASNSELRKQFRRLRGKYHPDRLEQKELPDYLMKAANEKWRSINDAWDQVRTSRKIS